MPSTAPRLLRVALAQALVATVLVVPAPCSAQSSERAAATLIDAIHIVAGDAAGGRVAARAGGPAASPLSAAHPDRAAFDVAPSKRPALLLPLYGSFAVLQGLDAHSTLEGVRRGTAVERNPLLRPFSDNPGALIAIKVATTAGTILLAEKMWRRHPVRAVVLLAAVNAAYGAIVAVNTRR